MFVNLPISSLPELTSITNNTEFIVEYQNQNYKISGNNLYNGLVKGCFISTSIQTFNSVYPPNSQFVRMSDTIYNNGIVFSDGYNFSITKKGVYYFRSYLQIYSPNGSQCFFTLWLNKNGNPVENSVRISQYISINKTDLSYSFITPCENGDTFSLKIGTTNLGSSLSSSTSQESPLIPEIPSVFFIINQIS